MWKQRRLSRSEKRFVVAEVGLDTIPPGPATPLEQLCYELSVLEGAQKEIASTGTLSPATYKTVLYPLELARTEVLKPRWLQPKDDSSPSEVKLDDQFAASLEEAQTKLYFMFWRLRIKKKQNDYHDAHALPGEAEVEQILRYDKALQKKYDWALQKLLESQERRRKAQAPVSLQGPSDQ